MSCYLIWLSPNCRLASWYNGLRFHRPHEHAVATGLGNDHGLAAVDCPLGDASRRRSRSRRHDAWMDQAAQARSWPQAFEDVIQVAVHRVVDALAAVIGFELGERQ